MDDRRASRGVRQVDLRRETSTVEDPDLPGFGLGVAWSISSARADDNLLDPVAIYVTGLDRDAESVSWPAPGPEPESGPEPSRRKAR